MESSAPSTPEYEPGWYEFHGGQRFWDGDGWTEHYAPPPPPSQPVAQMGFWKTTAAVALGGTVAGMIVWALVYLGAQADPDSIYWPVKFVVDDLPSGLR